MKELTKIQKPVFFIEEIVLELTRKYPPSQFKGSFCSLGSYNLERALKPFMEAAKRFGVYVGIDEEILVENHPYINKITDGDVRLFLKLPLEKGYLERKKYYDGKSERSILYPTEKMVKEMTRGIAFIPYGSFDEINNYRKNRLIIDISTYLKSKVKEQ